MNNRPFFSTNTNLYDESIRTAAPTNLNGQNVLVSQDQQRKMFDTLNTSIMGLPTNMLPVTNPFSTGNFIQGQRQFVPGGVTFSFSSYPLLPQPQPYNMTQQICNCQQMPYNMNQMNPKTYPTTLEQQIAMSGLQKHGLETLQYQQQMSNNPFCLTFHQTRGTSCTDLLDAFTQQPGSRSSPDFSNMNGALSLQAQKLHPENINIPCKCQNENSLMNPLTSTNMQFPLPPIEFSSNARKLVLCNAPTENKGNVADVLDREKEAAEKERANEKERAVKEQKSCRQGTMNKTYENEKVGSDKKQVCFLDECMSESSKENTESKKEKVDKSEQALFNCTCNAKNICRSNTSSRKKRKAKSSNRKPVNLRDNASSCSQFDKKKIYLSIYLSSSSESVLSEEELSENKIDTKHSKIIL